MKGETKMFNESTWVPQTNDVVRRRGGGESRILCMARTGVYQWWLVAPGKKESGDLITQDQLLERFELVPCAEMAASPAGELS